MEMEGALWGWDPNSDEPKLEPEDASSPTPFLEFSLSPVPHLSFQVRPFCAWWTVAATGC